MLIKWSERSVFTEVSEGVEDAAHKQTLTYSVCDWLHEIPTKPVNLVDAVIGDAELSGEQHEGCLEEHQIATSCPGVKLILFGL